MTNKSQERLDALRATVSAIATAQTPNEALLKRLRALSEINPDAAGVVAFAERAMKLEAELGRVRQQLADAKRFDIRLTGVRAEDLPEVRPGADNAGAGDGRFAKYAPYIKTRNVSTR